MRNQILTAITPTPEQLINGWFFVCLLLGIFGVLAVVWWISEHALDTVIVRIQRRRAGQVIDFTERRRLSAIVALRGDR